ncbi:MAG: MFS transporter, partial [Burkholderiaceae bacterium]|nr:MFS transporter [Burkholderiaceae bacterium]
MNRQELLKVIRPIAPFKKAPIFILVAFCLMMQSLSTDLYVASLPALGKAFDASPSIVQLTLSVFMVAFGFAQLIAGPLSDRFGRRPVLVFGLMLYVLASAACALSFSIWLLITARFFQALGCCASLIVARAIVRDAYAPEHGMQIMVRASSWLSVTPMLVPIIGAYLQVCFGWRGSFVLHTILSAALAIAIYLHLPE